MDIFTVHMYSFFMIKSSQTRSWSLVACQVRPERPAAIFSAPSSLLRRNGTAKAAAAKENLDLEKDESNSFLEKESHGIIETQFWHQFFKKNWRNHPSLAVLVLILVPCSLAPSVRTKCCGGMETSPAWAVLDSNWPLLSQCQETMCDCHSSIKRQRTSSLFPKMFRNVRIISRQDRPGCHDLAR